MHNIENIIRARLRQFQKVYDRLPVAAQNVLTTIRGLFLMRLRYQPLFWQTLEEILGHDAWTYDQLVAYQNLRLREILQAAYEQIPYYQQLFDSHGLRVTAIESVDQLDQIPILERANIRRNFKAFLRRGTNNRVVVHTSGSSGAGLPIAYSRQDLARNWAFTLRQFTWAGVQPREWRLTLFGSKIVPEGQQKPPYWRVNLFERQILMSIFHLSEATRKDYLAFLRDHQGQVLEGFASVLGIVADFVLRENDSIPMKMVYSTGEPMDERVREKVEQAFACQVYDCYGMTEWAGLIQQCEMGRKHLISDFGILEILDDYGRPAAPNEEGHLVWTSLQKEEMPFIRYKIGDKGVWSLQSHCECGKPYQLVDATITRDGDIIRTPSGELLSPRVLNQFLKDKVSFNFCQFIQDDSDEVVIRVVPGEGDFHSEAQALARDLDRLFKGKMEMTIHYEEKPIMRGVGKFPLIINQVAR